MELLAALRIKATIKPRPRKRQDLNTGCTLSPVKPTRKSNKPNRVPNTDKGKPRIAKYDNRFNQIDITQPYLLVLKAIRVAD